MPKDPLSLLEQEDVERDNDADRLGDLVVDVATSGLNLRNTSYEDMLAANLTVDDVEKALRGLQPYYANEILSSVWAQAAGIGVVSSARYFTFKDLFKFKKWMATDQGKTSLRHAQHKVKLTKSGKGQFPPEEMTLLRLHQACLDDVNEWSKKQRAVTDAAVQRYRAKIAKLEDDFAKARAKRMARHPVLQSYPGLNLSDLRDLCWKAYLAHCQAKEEVPAPKTPANLELITTKFSKEVQDRHLVEFLKQQDNRAELLEFGARKIKRLQKLHDTSRVNTFRGYIAILDPQGTATAPAGGEGDTNPADSDGAPEIEDLGDNNEPAGSANSSQRVEEEDGGWGETEAPGPEEAGTSRRTTRASRRKRTGKGVAGDGDAPPPRHPKRAK